MHYAGKKGFTSLNNKRAPKATLNLWQLSEIAERLASEKKAQPATERIIVDLGQLGFKKLLGAGVISRPVQVKVDECSASALKKIKDAGGEAVLKTAVAPASPK